MKKKLLVLASTMALIVLIGITSCNKGDIIMKDTQVTKETNVHIVPIDIATQIARTFNPNIFFGASNANNHSPTRSALNGNNTIIDAVTIKDENEKPLFYVFNFADNNGFVFVSGDYNLSPVLAFVEKGIFKKEKAPSGIIQWVDKTIDNIKLVRQGKYDNSKNAQQDWDGYLNKNYDPTNQLTILGMNPPPAPPPALPSNITPTVVNIGPLLPVTWGQECSYNDLCGDFNINYNCNYLLGCNTRPVTGCVATAMAQVINYWHPNNSLAYDYVSMPTSFGNAEVQRLMRDAGNTVNMDYHCANDGGSSAYDTDVQWALKSNFGFSTASFASYNYYTLTTDIFNNKPVLMSGCRTQTQNWFIINWWTEYSNCHEWVCDGFSGTVYPGRLVYLPTSPKGVVTYQSCTACVDNGFFHMNWGWHETRGGNDFNGWFLFNNWNIPGIDRNYQYADGMTKDIHP